MQKVAVTGPRNPGLEFMTDLASTDSALTRNYVAFLASARGTREEANLYFPTAQNLAHWGAQVAAWTLEGVPISALYFFEPRPSKYFLGGVKSDAQFRKHGLTAELISCTVKAITRAGADCIDLDVRWQLGPNPAAFRLFVKQTFLSVGIHRVALTGSDYDKHLYRSAEADRKSILSLRMRKSLSSYCSRSVLKEAA